MSCTYAGPREGVGWLVHMGACEECKDQAWDEHEVPFIAFGAVPGGSTKASVMKAKSQKFDKDMHAYREARRHGLQPEQISTEAVEEAEKVAYGAINEHHRIEN